MQTLVMIEQIFKRCTCWFSKTSNIKNKGKMGKKVEKKNEIENTVDFVVALDMTIANTMVKHETCNVRLEEENTRLTVCREKDSSTLQIFLYQ